MSAYGLAMRKNFHDGDEVRDKGLTTPEGIKRYDDIQYGPDAKWNKLDVYRPADKSGKLPVIVSFHGGGWVYGDKERYQYYCMSLAQHGFAVVNFTYRLSPEFQHPANFEDMNMVAGWIMDNADQYELDTDHIFGVGDSAGANGIGINAAILTNPEYAMLYDFTTPKGFAFRAIGTICGTYRIDLDNDEDEVTRPLIAEYLPNGGTKVEMDKLDVWKHMTVNYPPVFAASGSGDFLKIQLPHLVQNLLQYEIPFEIRFYTTEEGSLGHDFHCNVKLKEAGECADDLCRFFHKYC